MPQAFRRHAFLCSPMCKQIIRAQELSVLFFFLKRTRLCSSLKMQIVTPAQTASSGKRSAAKSASEKRKYEFFCNMYSFGLHSLFSPEIMVGN